MKNTAALLIIGALLAITLACERDKDNPTVSIVSHSEWNMVWNTTTIQLNVEDDFGVVKVEFFVEGVLVSTINSSPWEVPWDTRNYPDDTVLISVKAYDEVGNASREVSLNLVIQNVLLTMTIEEGALSEDPDHIRITKCPVYLTSAEGSLLDWALMGNGETKVFMRPESFDGEVFDLARGYFYKRTDDPLYFSGTLYTYMDIKPGELVLEAYENESVIGDYIGTCYFSSANISPDDYSLLSYRGWQSYGSIHSDSAWVDVYENYRQAYFYLHQGGFGYYTTYENLEPERAYLIYSEDLSGNMASHTINFPSREFDNLRAYVDAYPVQGDYDADDRTMIYSESIYPDEQSAIRFHYPTGFNAPGDFNFRAYTYLENDISYYYSKYGALPGSYSNINAFIYDISVALPGPIQVEMSGSADIQTAYLSLYDEEGSLSIAPRGPVGQVLRIPRIPTEILSQYNIPAVSNSNLNYVYFYLTEHNDKNGYYPLVNDWSGMQSLESYYSSGTEIREIDYFKYYGSDVKAAKMVPGHAGEAGREDPRNRYPTVDGPLDR